jgi:hypothetical protein
MGNMIDWVNGNAIVSSLVTAAIIGAMVAAWKWRRDLIDAQKIHGFLEQSSGSTEFEFRSTEAISSDTNISEGRVEALCARDPRVRRNKLKKKSWTLR